MELTDAKKIIEALLFVADQPISLRMLDKVFDSQMSKDDLQSLLHSIAEDYRERGSAIEAREIAGGWQLCSRPEFGPWIRKLFKDKLSYRLSGSSMETLAIVAYKQPISRAEIEEIRGVEVTAVLDTLVDRKLLKIVGRKESVGRPLLYGTTPDFLRAFGLKRLEDLPSVESLALPTTMEATDVPLDEQQTRLPLDEAVGPAASPAAEAPLTEEAPDLAAPSSEDPLAVLEASIEATEPEPVSVASDTAVHPDAPESQNS